MTGPSGLLFDTYYHINNRGVNRQTIFFVDQNYHRFISLYSKYIIPIADTFAYCLLSNHFHLLVRIRAKDEVRHMLDKNNIIDDSYPSKMFSNLFNAYAKSINHEYHRTGSLFQHPFGRVMISNDSQFLQVIAYIHQNPQKHGFVDDFRQWRYSSYQGILSNVNTNLQREKVLDWFGGKEQYIFYHNREIINKLFDRNPVENFDEKSNPKGLKDP